MAVLMTTPATAETASGSVSPPIIEGLIGPLGLDVSDNGTIYVAESFAGRLTRVLPNGTRSTLFEFPIVSPNGVTATNLGRVVVAATVGAAGPEQPASETGLFQVGRNGATRPIVSLKTYEENVNPDQVQTYGFTDLPPTCAAKVPPDFQPYNGLIDSNPYKVTEVGLFTYAVADAGGNSILRVAGGTASTVALLPPVPQRITPSAAVQIGLPLCTVGRIYTSEPVPTDVEVGPDGFWYVSSLPGFPELPNSGSVFRVNPDTGAVKLVARGFSGAVDLAVADDGTIYVAELDGNRISAISNGVVSKVVDLFSPGAVEIADDGTIYATTGVFGPSGSVVTITP